MTTDWRVAEWCLPVADDTPNLSQNSSAGVTLTSNPGMNPGANAVGGIGQMRAPNHNQHQNQSTMNTTSTNSEITMSCPNCQKLYSVKSDLVMSSTGPLIFNCVSCQTRFSATPNFSGLNLFLDVQAMEMSGFDFTEPSLPDLNRETPVQKARAPIEKVPTQEVDCPKCGELNSITSSECRSCGVVFAKFRDVSLEDPNEELRRNGHQELVELWNAIMADYGNESLHEKFIMACDRTKNLTFASQKYARILSVTPQEEIAARMRKRIIALASHIFETVRPEAPWQFRVPSLNSLAMVLGSALTTMGFMLPGMKDLSKVGIATLILTFGLRFALRPPPR